MDSEKLLEHTWNLSYFNFADVKRSLADAESQKLAAMKCMKTEKEARIILEKKLDSIREELERAHQNLTAANEKVKTLEDKNKMLQEHNMKLESRLETATNANDNLQREKDMILKYNITLEKLCLIYETQIANDKDLGDDAVEQKETSEEN